MKLRKMSLPLVVALVFTATACSSGSTTSRDEAVVTTSQEEVVVAKPRTKNAALPAATTSSSQTASNGVLTPYAPTDNSATRTTGTVGVFIQTQEVFIPQDFCRFISVNCGSLSFAQVTVSGSSVTATAVIPNSSVRLPSGNGFAFQILSTSLKVVVAGAESSFSVIANATLEVKGMTMPLVMTGRYTPAKNTIEVELTNPNVGLNDFLGINGYNISAVTGKFSFMGVVPDRIGFSITGTLPTFLREMGVAPGTTFTTAFESGLSGFTMGMSVGSQANNSPNIFNFKNILSARYLAFSFSTTGSTIAGVTYPQGFAIAFDGKFGTTTVVVSGVIVLNPALEFTIDFAIGAFALGGFEFESSIGTIARSGGNNSLQFNGALAGYGISGRLIGKFDAVGGIQLVGAGAFVPGGVNLGSFSYSLVANSNGFQFQGTKTDNYGVFVGTATVGFRAFVGKKIAFNLGIAGGLRVPGVPSYASVEGSLTVTNCPGLTCTSPTAVPTATVTGTSAFHNQARQEFSATVNPSNWSFSKVLSFNYNKNFNYSSNGISVGVSVSGAGSATISNTGISFGNGTLQSSAGFDFPARNIPAVTVPETSVRKCRKVAGIEKCINVKVDGYTVTPGYTVPGGRTNLSSSVGKDSNGYYVTVTGGSGVGGNRFNFS